MSWPQNVGNRISEDAPRPQTGDRLRQSYYRTPFCEILDPSQTLLVGYAMV